MDTILTPLRKLLPYLAALAVVIWAGRGCMQGINEGEKDNAARKIVTDSVARVEKLNQDSADKAYQKAWEASKAGKLQKKHPDWSNNDCELVAAGKIWIGMSYAMLKYERGDPSSVNPSNYGSGQQYQCCWDDIRPSCFYFKEDQIIYAYN